MAEKSTPDMRPFLRWLLGKPLPSSAASHQRLTNAVALAVFASDALSSVAYATEEVLHVLVPAGLSSGVVVLGVAGAILLLLAMLVASYGQTVTAYPSGGGAYLVAKDNLGRHAGLVAGASLLVDYVLTAAVSVSAGISAVVSAFPSLASRQTALCLFALAGVVVLNLRGVKESGRAFAAPTYFFIASLGAMIVVGLLRLPFAEASSSAQTFAGPGLGAASAWVLLKAFASGCTALTGVEAISNGVPAFRDPSAANAKKTLGRMGWILASLFLGVSVLAVGYGATPRPGETVLSQLGRHAFGSSPFYFALQGATALILLLAANTSFADFPRLSSLMAKDRFLPTQLSHPGDRLAFSNGILLLGALAGLLILLFGGDVHLLIPLYAVGVFLSFTLSQGGMVVRWVRKRGPGWARNALVNLLGFVATLAVLGTVVATKFTHGAWVVCIVIPALVFWFTRVHRHYSQAELKLQLGSAPAARPLRHLVVIPVSRLHRGVAHALEYARSLTDRIQAVTVNVDPEATQKLLAEWKGVAGEVPLTVVESPFRALVEPLVAHLDSIDAAREGVDLVTVVIPEFVPRRFWHRMLHNQTALLLIAALSTRPNVVVTTVRVPLDA